MSLFQHSVDISFGDCDPAGLVFYPNYFRWMDATFHAFLHIRAGGHASLCKSLGARGIGLMESRLMFRSPANEGERLLYEIDNISWEPRSLTLTYSASAEGRHVLEGMERRGVFVMDGARMKAADLCSLKDSLQ